MKKNIKKKREEKALFSPFDIRKTNLINKKKNKIKTVSETQERYCPPITNRPKVKVILRSKMYTCCLVAIQLHPFARIWYAYVKKQKHDKTSKNLTLRSIIKVNTSSYGDTLVCQIW